MATRLLNRNFFLLWQGQLVSQLGSQAFFIAMMLWIKHQTGSASLVGLIMMISMLPFVILGPIAGTFADHFSRRKIIIFCDILSGIPVLILAFLMFNVPEASNFLIVCLFFVSLTLGIIRSFFNPAISASIPDIVPHEKVSAANSMNQSSNQISLFIGQALGGYLFVTFGAPLLFLIDGITYLFSAFSETFIKIPQKIPEKSEVWRDKLSQFKSDTIGGFRYVWRNTGIRAFFFAAAIINFFSIPIIVLLPFYVEDFLHLKADWYGYILASFGFGSLIGYGLAGTLKIKGPVRSKAVISALILMASCLPILSIVNVGLLALILMTTIGILNGFLNINIFTILQTAVPSEIRGRVFGLFITITSGLTPISMGLSGVIADLLNQNIPLIYATCGITTLLLCILVSFSKDLRRFLQSV
ncbi:MAG: MFS transporter [Candidatus Aminicenantes bacterium]|nr:MAG: MFS transporter [Candidatus Aminicenantes bacterium]